MHDNGPQGEFKLTPPVEFSREELVREAAHHDVGGSQHQQEEPDSPVEDFYERRIVYGWLKGNQGDLVVDIHRNCVLDDLCPLVVDAKRPCIRCGDIISLQLCIRTVSNPTCPGQSPLLFS